MELITISLLGIAAGVFAVLGTVLSRLLTDEAKAWIPWLTERIIRLSVYKLASEQRDRYDEEWRSHINELPGDLGRLFVATQFFFAAKRMSTNERPRIQFTLGKLKLSTFLWVGLVAVSALTSYKVKASVQELRVTVNHVHNSIVQQQASIGTLRSKIREIGL